MYSNMFCEAPFHHKIRTSDNIWYILLPRSPLTVSQLHSIGHCWPTSRGEGFKLWWQQIGSQKKTDDSWIFRFLDLNQFNIHLFLKSILECLQSFQRYWLHIRKWKDDLSTTFLICHVWTAAGWKNAKVLRCLKALRVIRSRLMSLLQPLTASKKL